MYRRTRAMILLAAYAGLRVSEIVATKGDDVDNVINTITVVGKGDKERQIPLHPILKDLATVMPRRAWWFPTYIGNTKHLAGGPMHGNSVSSSISNVMDRAGIPGNPPRPTALVRLSVAGGRCRLPGHQRTDGSRIPGYHRHLRRRTPQATDRSGRPTPPHEPRLDPIKLL